MSDNAQVDLDNAPIDGGEPPVKVHITPKAVEAAAPVQVEEKPLGVTQAMNIEKKDTGAEVPKNPAPEAPPKPEEAIKDPNTKVDTLIENVIAETFGARDLFVNQLAFGKRETEYINKKLHDLYPDEESQKKASEDPLSMFNLIIGAFRDGWGSNQAMSLVDCLMQKNEAGKAPIDNLVHYKDEKVSSLGDGVTYHIKTGSVDISGEEARDAFMTELSGMKRVKLLNSGFWVTIRRPLIHELQEVFDAADMEQREAGYSIGAHFALAADVFIKQKFCQALIKYRIIRDSNLKDIFNVKDDVFFKALAYHDYEVLVHAVLSLMSRKGLRARVVCPECFRATMLDNIDVASSKYYNLDLITPQMKDWFDAKVDANGKPIGKRTLEDLEHYRKDILGFKMSWTEDFDPTKIRVNFSEPTMYKYFVTGEKLIRRIQDAVDEVSTDDEDRRKVILANLGAHVYHMLTPWVDTIEILDDNGNTRNRTSDAEAIMNTFDITTQENSPRPLDELSKFLAASKITYIGTFALECPYCHAKPDCGANQFYPLEAQTIFFGQLFRLLPEELTRRGA